VGVQPEIPGRTCADGHNHDYRDVVGDGSELVAGGDTLVGKAAVTNFIRDAVSHLAAYKMLKVEMSFHDIRVCGDWATEWGIEHQVIQPPDDKPVIDHWGKIALVLHREGDGNWRVQQEMWNSTPKPE
jgi:ketosteroid isomerase-like protein